MDDVATARVPNVFAAGTKAVETRAAKSIIPNWAKRVMVDTKSDGVVWPINDGISKDISCMSSRSTAQKRSTKAVHLRHSRLLWVMRWSHVYEIRVSDVLMSVNFEARWPLAFVRQPDMVPWGSASCRDRCDRDVVVSFCDLRSYIMHATLKLLEGP